MMYRGLLLAAMISLSVCTQQAKVTCSDGTSETYTCHETWGIKSSSKAWHDAGADDSKLAVGLAFYSHTFGKTQNDQMQSGLFDECTWCYSIPSVPAVIQYFAIKSAIIDNDLKMNNYNWIQCRDDVQQSPWLYTSDACANNGCDNTKEPSNAPAVNFISYDDPESIKAKVQFAIDNKIGNLIIWELYGDTCKNDMLNAIREVIDASSFKPKVTAYYGNWRIYGANTYMPYIPKDLESKYSCTDAWSYSQPATGPRNWGVTSDIASKIDSLNIGFATISYAPTHGYFYAVSPDPNADYQTGGLPTGSGCTTMLRNPMCLVPFIGAYESADCQDSSVNTQGYMSYAQCGATQNSKSTPVDAETYSTGNKKMAGVYNAACVLKEENPNTKVGISVGGWYDSNYFSAATVDKQRLVFAKGLARYTDAFGFDHLDIDWEYPTNEHCNEDVPNAALPEWAQNRNTPVGCESDANTEGYKASSDSTVDCYKEGVECQFPERVYDPVNMVLFLRDAKKELLKLNSTHQLTMALRADPGWVTERMPAKLMNQYLDQFNDMTYDYNAAYNKYSALNSPLEGCVNDELWNKLTTQDCETTDLGALDNTGVFKTGAWSDCFGLCDGDNWGQAGSGLKMQFKKVKQYQQKDGKECGQLYNIQECSGTCSMTNPNFPDHYAEWKNNTNPDFWVQDWSKQPCGCKNITTPWSGEVTYPNITNCCENLCSKDVDSCEAAETELIY